jgi:hypothetical protein
LNRTRLRSVLSHATQYGHVTAMDGEQPKGTGSAP